MTIATTEQQNTQEDGILLWLNPNELQLPTEWENPRSTISDADYSDLLASVKVKGVHTPVAARYISTGYEIVAGFTRRRSAIEANLKAIPVLVRHMTVQEAIELAMSENIDRTAMSTLDEAKGLKRIVANHNGDIKAAASEMGWSKAKFDQALQLLRASDRVQGLIGKKQSNGFVLSVGHAARLSALPEKVQDKILDVVIAERMSINVLKDKIQKAIKRPLSSASFCQKECESCPFNTKIQTTLFLDDEESADCTNPTCFSEKSKAHFEKRQQELQDDYGKVVLLSTVDGAVGVSESAVGVEQYTEGCLSCSKHCAILVDKGLGQGDIREHQCLDKPCFDKKVKAHTTAATERKNQQDQATMDNTEQSKGKAESTAQSGSSATQGQENKASNKESAVIPKRLVLESQTALSEVAKPLLLQHPSYHMALVLASLTALHTRHSNVEEKTLEFMKLTPPELESKIMSLIGEITQGQSIETLNIERLTIRAAETFVDGYQEQAVTQWTPTKERLEAMTKTIREQALVKSGFKKAFVTAKSEKEFNALLNKKTDEQVKLILAFEFDWSGFAPDYYRTAIKTQKYNY
ncbi:putative chromosome-partitioning protein ParB [Vibrio thalassae]|uniref:Putative chromosome-partitioning protein ParB n=1 Tax=Vibrio thalassae TaxID=1243014 RepID=A0A240END3_9VIBR|nr:ParB/RepB/Spo0J family partition protein [Vibrio thalassae]SNX50124.1 putative chromosome-partitioning protein ParB [Vibrio thalassae]